MLEVLDGVRESLADTGTYDEVLGTTGDIELASLGSEAPCYLGRDGKSYGLETPTQTSYLVSGPGPTLTVRLDYADDKAAERDLEARREYLASGTFGSDDEPLSSIGAASLSLEGSVITIELSEMNSNAARTLTQPPGILTADATLDA